MQKKIDCTKCESNECGKCAFEDIHLTKVDAKNAEETIEKLCKNNIAIKCWKLYLDYHGDWWNQYSCPCCGKIGEYIIVDFIGRENYNGNDSF